MNKCWVIKIFKRAGTRLTETPNLINKFFAEIGSTLADAIPMASDPDVLRTENDIIGIPINPMSPEKIADFFSKLDSNKSSGCPIFTTRLYLDLLPHLTEQVSFIFSLSLKTKKLPLQWKIGIVTPIPKKGNCTILDNLRPISITNIVGKVLEKYICNFIQSHFDKYDIISPNQMGFRKGFSTLDAATELILILKLRAIGLHPDLCSWLEDYLS